MDFAKSITTAGMRPDPVLPPGAPDVFDPASKAVELPIVDSKTDPLVIPTLVGYDLTYHCRRFFIGKELEAIDQNTKIYADRDESADLREVLELCLRGRGVIQKRMDTFLQDGSVVVWLEWATLPTKGMRRPEDEDPNNPRLSREKLMSTAHRDEEAEEPAPEPDDEEGESHEDEEPWE